MILNRANYEIWLIDYLDGNLDEVRSNQLISFLEENPDIREDFSDILTYNIKPETGTFRFKESLKKNPTDLSDSQFDYLCISASENDLPSQQRRELDSIIANNPEKKETYEIISRLKLVAPKVTYRRKSELRRLTTTQKIVRLSVAVLSAAAGIALIVSLFNMPVSENVESGSPVSANISVDSSKSLNKTNEITANANPAVNTEVIKPRNKTLLSNLEKTISDEMKAFPAESHTVDTATREKEIRATGISKIGFKQEVNITEKEFSSTLVAIATDDILITDPLHKSGFNEFIAKTFREKILRSKTPEKGSLKVYEIADAGINGLNKLLGWQMSLQKTRNEKGDLKSLYFSSKMLKFNAPVKKVQAEP